jgi:FtsH-binding integral membrane protein
MNRPPIPYEPMVSMAYMHKARDEDRREYRRRVIWVLALNLVVMIGLRMGIDVLFAQHQLRDYQHLKPYTMLVMLGFFFAIWVLGIWVSFQRRYP